MKMPAQLVMEASKDASCRMTQLVLTLATVSDVAETALEWTCWLTERLFGRWWPVGTPQRRGVAWLRPGAQLSRRRWPWTRPGSKAGRAALRDLAARPRWLPRCGGVPRLCRADP